MLGALVSNDDLMLMLAFKGGNAIDWFHGGPGRGSLDLDFSLDLEKPVPTADELQRLTEPALAERLAELGLAVFDVAVVEVPDHQSDEQSEFWGGFKVRFKTVKADDYERYKTDFRDLQRRALDFGGPATFEIDISKHEYCTGKELREIDGLSVYVYSVELIVAEKIRALCQQVEDYCRLVNHKPRARAQDLFDVHYLIETHGLDVLSPEFVSTLHGVFASKRCDRDLLLQVEKTFDLHQSDFGKLASTVQNKHLLKSFDEHCDYVRRLCNDVHAAWIK